VRHPDVLPEAILSLSLFLPQPVDTAMKSSRFSEEVFLLVEVRLLGLVHGLENVRSHGVFEWLFEAPMVVKAGEDGLLLFSQREFHLLWLHVEVHYSKVSGFRMSSLELIDEVHFVFSWLGCALEAIGRKHLVGIWAIGGLSVW